MRVPFAFLFTENLLRVKGLRSVYAAMALHPPAFVAHSPRFCCGIIPVRKGERVRISVTEAVQRLQSGGIVAIPTETVYGLAANALRPQSVARVFEAKQRPFFDPLIVHLPDASALPALVRDIPVAAERLMQRFWPGPLTLVLHKQNIVPDLVTAGLPTVAVRVPDHPMALEILAQCGCTLAAPSANLFGRISPTCADDVLAQLGKRIYGVVDGGPSGVGVESTIVDFTGAQPTLLRPGGIAKEDIEALIGPLAQPSDTDTAAHAPLRAPGTSPRHYAPLTPFADRHTLPPMPNRRVGLIAFGSNTKTPRTGFAEIYNLSDMGNLREAATRLYPALHHMDKAGLDAWTYEPIPQTGLGLAINDRLQRAATRNDDDRS